jgi:hypothetical protein
VTESIDRTRHAAQLERFGGPAGFENWLRAMERNGVSVNVGSFLGGTNVRTYAKGSSAGPPTDAELDSMRKVVRWAMEGGAFGIATALIYPPASFATTEELIEASRAMAPYGGHMVVFDAAVVCLGSAERYLGLLAATVFAFWRAERTLSRESRGDTRSQNLGAPQLGAIPDYRSAGVKAPVPVATIHVEGLPELPESCVPGRTALTLEGMLEFGYAVDGDGNASFIRITGARLLRIETQYPMDSAQSEGFG